jgi:ATP-dependent DNA ligase
MYLFPPRAEKAIKPEELEDVEPDTWIAQPKYNGSCSSLFLKGHEGYELYNRHRERLTLQRPIRYELLNDSDKWMVLCGEYLNKNKLGEGKQPFNHKFVIWDILVWQGTYLLGWETEQRLSLLYELFGTSRAAVTDTHFSLYEHLISTHVKDVYLAPTYTSYFKPLYDDLIQTDLYEGLVLKRAKAKLEIGMHSNNNSRWQIKARKETLNYKF